MQRLRFAAIATLMCACSASPERSQPRTGSARPAAARVDVAVTVDGDGACCPVRPAPRDQPPEIKLKLGHYTNAQRGIGLVFDRTTAQAKLRFDGTAQVIKVDRQHGPYGRIDYIRRIGDVVLQQWDNGRVVVYVEGAPDGIEVRRDGDADPL